MTTTLLLVIYCLAIVAASLAGGLVPLVIRLTHTRLQVAISFTAGFMLGVAVLHMVPHALMDASTNSAMLWLLAGLLAMFFIERFFSFHSHEVAELDDQGKVLTASEHLHEHEPNDHAHHHDHAHAHGMVGHTPGNKMSWTGAAIGMTLHSMIGGVALASAVAAETKGIGGHETTALAGLAVFLVIVTHKPLDALTVITLTASSGFAKSTRHLINAVFALAVPAGVVLFAFGLNQTALGDSSAMIGAAIAFSAGTFLCISLSDLLPELHFHAHDRAKLSVALLVGVALAYAAAQGEHLMHDHEGHEHGHAAEIHDHDGHDHEIHEDHGAHEHDAHEGHDH